MKKLFFIVTTFFASTFIFGLEEIPTVAVETEDKVIQKLERQKFCNAIFRQMIQFLPIHGNWADDCYTKKFEALVFAYDCLKCIDIEKK